MDTLIQQLQDALTGALAIERELGGGGMSRVFLARDIALDRRVVVKVLPAEMMAGANLDRFRREILVAARLQHANIVPVLSAGELDGAPYYTMPFVEGESLRDHLRERGALPVAEVVTLMKDVARALVAAHAHGVVHRDIKPENILLSGGAAMVADFGIAKAIVAARAPATGERERDTSVALTGTGMSLGTPAYMAPEQAAGDPNTDHRADLYAWGAIAYEALAGRPVFEGRNVQELVAAHMAQTPVPIAERRAETPPALAALIMKCLSKNPDDRPSSAAEVVAALDAGASPSGDRPRRSRLGMAVGAAGVLALALVALRVLGIWPVASLFAKGVMKEHDRVVVTDFRAVHADSAFGTVLSEAVRTALGQSNAIGVVAPGDVSGALKLMRRDPAAPLDVRVARDVALREGAKAVVDGDVSGVAGGGYVVSLRLVSADSGQELAALHAAAKDANGLIAAADGLARDLRSQIGESLRSVRATPPLAELTTTSIDALRWYAAAGAAERNADVDATLADLRQAVRLDSAFAMAWADLAVDLTRVGLFAAGDSALSRAYASRDHLSDDERLWVMGQYLGGVSQRDPVAAARAWQQLVDDGDSTAALANLGTLLLNRRDYARALPIFLAADHKFHDGNTRSNLAAVLFNLGRAHAAESLVAVVRKETPKFVLLPMWEAELAYQRADYKGVARIADSARATATPGYPVWGSYRLADLALEQGQVARFEQYLRDARAAERARGAVALPLIDSVLFAYRDVVMSATPTRGVERLDAALARQPLDTSVDAEVAYLAVAAYAMGGHADRARAVLARYDAGAALDTVQRRLDTPVRHRMAAEIALADGHWMEAIAEFRRSDTTTAGIPDGTCRICAYAELGRAFDRANMPDSAIAAYDAYVTTPLFMRGSSRKLRIGAGDPYWLPAILRRLGQLYEAKGDRQHAADAYSRFVALWSAADPEFQPLVTEARARLAALKVEGR
ncbi:MAG TPA: serine/threonine-protein kinase [Gemmatimonadaceae bacterium]|nr:serine/threonine-protein kinase [Gemmatimonadaceae bacterium]